MVDEDAKNEEDEAQRQLRLRAAELEFEAAMKEHKRVKRIEEQHRRRLVVRTNDDAENDTESSLPISPISKPVLYKKPDSAVSSAATPTSPLPSKPEKGAAVDSSNDAEVFIKDALKGSGLNYDEIVSGEASEKLTKIKLDKEKTRRDEAEKALEERIERLREEQLKRRLEWEREDEQRISRLEDELRDRQRARDAANARRWDNILTNDSHGKPNTETTGAPSGINSNEVVSEIYQPKKSQKQEDLSERETSYQFLLKLTTTTNKSSRKVLQQAKVIANAAKVASIVPPKVDLAAV